MINDKNAILLGDEDYITMKKCSSCKDYSSADVELPFDFDFVNQHAKEFFFEEYKKANYYLILPYEY